MGLGQWAANYRSLCYLLLEPADVARYYHRSQDDRGGICIDIVRDERDGQEGNKQQEDPNPQQGSSQPQKWVCPITHVTERVDVNVA